MITLGDMEVPVSEFILLDTIGWVGSADTKHTRRTAVSPLLPVLAATNMHFL